MSPAKKPVTKVRPRSEIVVAVAVAVGIVLATVFLVWALRPADPGVPGTGGIMTRQSRVWLWLALSLGVLAFAIWWVRNGRHRPRRLKAATAIALTVVIVGGLALVAAILWPSGLIKHTPKAAIESETPPPVVPPTSAPPATQPRATTPPTTKGP